MSSLLLLA